ncbi:MAG: DNA-directed RNA polymerase subunit omega [Chlorobi bacterium]|nr:DNA-directed RNA polymerase subunit omega [Chlorobiota bacterium]
MPIRPVDLRDITGDVSSLYEAIVIMSKRARQINDELKQNLDMQLEEVVTQYEDEQEMTDNPDQIAISKEFDKIPKPTFLAIDEMLDREVEHRYRDEA